MPAHKYWQARLFATPTPATLELSELQLWSGATRVDAPATLTANTAPSTGTLATLKDDSTATGAYWSGGGESVVLTWAFASATAVDGIKIGSRTTASRFPSSLILMGGDVTPESSGAPVFSTLLAFAAGPFVSATLSPVRSPTQPAMGDDPLLRTLIDHINPGGIGRVPFEVVEEILPRTDPKTYRPQWAKVRLERDIDGKVIREQWSDKVTGLGVFENVDENFTYTVTAIYPTTGMRAVIADRIKPENYPELEAP